MNKPQSNLNQNSYIFIQENAFENVVWKMLPILFQPQGVKATSFHYQGFFQVRSAFYKYDVTCSNHHNNT